MREALLAATGLAIGVGAWIGYSRTRDPLHPMLFLGPLFLYATVLDPILAGDSLDRFFQQPGDIETVLLLNLMAVTALVCGTLHGANRQALRRLPHETLSRVRRARLRQIALCLGIVSLLAYGYSISNRGGFVEAFSRVKGGGSAASGYIGEAMNLGLVGAGMVTVAQYRRGWTVAALAILVVGLAPNVVQGTFGGRRGPLFLSIAMAAFAFLLGRRRRPTVWALVLWLAVAALSVAFVWSQRQHLYLGSENAAVDWEQFESSLTNAEVEEGNNFVYSTGFVLATRHAGRFTWGHELAVNLFVRPVPRQLWPRKYEDVGATWITNDYPGLGHLSVSEWIDAVGWAPLPGSSGMSIGDLFGEFGWGAVVVMYIVGRGFAALYRRRQGGGQWILLYLEAVALSIYLATQSFSAFYHRFLILAVPTILLWRFVGNQRTPRAVTARRVALRVPAVRKLLRETR